MRKRRGWAVILLMAVGACGVTAPPSPEAPGDARALVNPAVAGPRTAEQPAPDRTAPAGSPALTSSRALAIKERMAQVPDWAVFEEGNFLILHSTKVKAESIRAIAAGFRNLLKVLAKNYPMDGGEEALYVAFICKNASQYSQYGGTGDCTGHWSPTDREMVSYVDESASKWSLLRIPGLLVHAYFFEALGSVAPHEWFSLGLSSFYSAGTSNRHGEFIASRNRDFYMTMKEAKAARTFVPLEPFLHYDRTQFLGLQVRLNYAQAWSFVSFLQRQKAPEWRGVLSAYYEALRSGVREREGRPEADTPGLEERIRESAWQSVFGKFDRETWARLEKAWLDFE